MVQAKAMIPETDVEFLKLGRVLRDLSEECDNVEQFKVYCEDMGLSYRKARYLVNIYQMHRDLGIPKEDLYDLGWTKASVLIPVMRRTNWKMWFARASRVTTVTLKRMVATGAEVETQKLLVLPVKEKTQRLLFKRLDEMGARKGSERWGNLDAVLTKMVQSSRE